MVDKKAFPLLRLPSINDTITVVPEIISDSPASASVTLVPF